MKPTIDEDTLLMFNFEKDFDQDYFLSYYYGIHHEMLSDEVQTELSDALLLFLFSCYTLID